MSDIAQRKQKLRLQLSEQRKQLSAEQYTDYSKQIITHLMEYLSTVISQEPVQLLVYRALAHEVNTSLLFEADNFQVFAPRILPDMGMQWVAVNSQTPWQSASFGVLEPKQGKLWEESDVQTVLIAPLLGFDREGNRLGMGKGYFDRWLDKHGDGVNHQLGLAFSCQELPKIPMEPHDAALSKIITERGVISCPTH